MKTNLTLDKIEKTRGGAEFAELTLTIKKLKVSSLYEAREVIVKLRGGNHNLRSMSSHLVYEMKFILEWLEKNSNEIILFSKEMLKANNKLKDTLTFNN